MRRYSFAILGAATTLSATSVSDAILNAEVAAYCSFDIPDQRITGDIAYGPASAQWPWCRDEFLLNVAEIYGMEAFYWDTGYGWSDACNMEKGFGRLTAARILLDVSSPYTQRDENHADLSQPIIDWGLLYTTAWIDELRVNCSNEDGDLARAKDSHVEVYARTTTGSAFFSLDVLERASTLLHESSHLAGAPEHKVVENSDGTVNHKDQAFIPNAASAAGGSAWATEAVWLYDYASLATNGSQSRYCRAWEYANAVVQTFFIDPTVAFARPTRCIGFSE